MQWNLQLKSLLVGTWSRWSRKITKPKLHQKKFMITTWLLATGIIQYSIMNHIKTIAVTKYCQEPDQNIKNCNFLRPALGNWITKMRIFLPDKTRP